MELAHLVRTAASRARESAVSDRRRGMPLTEAVRQAVDVGAEVSRRATRRTPVVVVQLPVSLDGVTHVLAAIVSGYTVCLLDPADRRRGAALVDAVDPDVVVDGTGVHSRRAREVRDWPPGYVALSSGSTGGPPKGVLTPWSCLADFAPHGAEALLVDDRARWAEPNHPTYDLALTNWVIALASGASLHVSGALSDRLRPLSMVMRSGATHVRLAPSYVDLAAAEHARGGTCRLRVWASGGDRLTLRQAERVRELGVGFLVNTYGTSETAGFASAARWGPEEEVSASEGLVSIGEGRLGPWSLELAEDAPRLLAIRSPHVATGYAFGGRGQTYPRWEGGRVVTGDLGSRTGSQLFCFGRAGRLVKRSASFVNLDDIDVAVRAHRGLVSYTVATRAGTLVTLVEGEPLEASGVQEALRPVVAPDVVPDSVVSVPRLPRLANGKPDQAGALLIAEATVG